MRKRRMISLLLMVCIIFSQLGGSSITASAEIKGYYEYTVNSDGATCEIIHYTGSEQEITIPSLLDGYQVTSIGSYAFDSCKTITSIIIPEGVTSIGDFAFYFSEKITGITIPKSVTSIGYSAFYSCKALTGITIPEGVTSIGGGTFSSCEALKSVKIPNSVTSIEQRAFESCKELTSIIIPNGVTSIGESTFEGCTKLASVQLPNSVESIGDNAFDCCTHLTDITLPDSVQTIGKNAFRNCYGLTSITIPKSVTSIGEKAFYNDTKLKNVYFDGSMPGIDTTAFQGCPDLMYYCPSSNPGSITLPCTQLSTQDITVIVPGHGSIIPSTSQGMLGETVSLNVIPEEGYTLSSGSLLCNDNPLPSASFPMPAASVVIKADFEKIPVPGVTVASGSPTSDQTPDWSWTDTTNTGYYRYRLNSTDPWSYTVSKSFTPTGDLPEGDYTLYVQEMDRMGFWSASGSAPVTIDKIPTVTLASPMGTGVSVSGSSITLAFSETVKAVKAVTGGAIIISDGSNQYTFNLAEGDSYISGTGSGCRAVIPLTCFMKDTTALSLAYNTTYTVSVKAGAFVDSIGYKSAENMNVGSFMTEPLPMDVTLSSPTGIDVSVNETEVILSFNKTVTAVTGGSICIICDTFRYTDIYTYTIAPGDSIISGTDKSCRAVIPLSEFVDKKALLLTYDTDYWIDVLPGAFIDSNGNGNQEYEQSFTTEKPSVPYVSKSDMALKPGQTDIFMIYLGKGSNAATKAQISVAAPGIAAINITTAGDQEMIMVNAVAPGTTNMTITFDDTAKTERTIQVTVLDGPVVRLSAPTGTGVPITVSELSLTIDRTVTVVPNSSIMICKNADWQNGYIYIFKPADQYISNEGSNCRVTIPFTEFVNHNNNTFYPVYNSTYIIDLLPGAFIDSSGNATPYIEEVGSFTTETEAVAPGPSPGTNTNTNTNTNFPSVEGSEAKGWDSITRYIADNNTGSIIIDMNGETTVAQEIFEAVKGKDIDLTFDLGNGIKWMINGTDIPENTEASLLHGIDLNLSMNTDNIPAELLSALGDMEKVQISLKYDGSFGFTATLRLPMEKKYSGKFANLFYYNPVTNQLELQAIGVVDENGTVEFPFTHASEYLIVMSNTAMLEDAITQIAVTPKKKTLYIGGTKGNRVSIQTVIPEVVKKAVEDGLCKVSITYKSSKPKIATISSSGKITAKKTGTVTITTTIKVNGVEKRYKTKIKVKKALRR